jgi:ferredoxin-NADP reductase
VRLLYGAASRDQLVYADEIEAMRGEMNLEVDLVLAEAPPDWSGRTGILDGEMVRGWLPTDQPRHWLFFLCGPGPMMEAVESALHEAGVPLRRIIYERFAFD